MNGGHGLTRPARRRLKTPRRANKQPLRTCLKGFWMSDGGRQKLHRSGGRKMAGRRLHDGRVFERLAIGGEDA
jgi:hypothetical protein